MDYNRVKVAKSANVVKEAVLLGDVTVGEDCCILFHAVLRGDEDRIVVGKCSNIQDNCTVPVSYTHLTLPTIRLV